MKRARKQRSDIHEEWAFFGKDDPIVYVAKVINLSESGALIEVDAELDVRAKLTAFSFANMTHLPSQDLIANDPSHFIIQVVRQQDDDQYGVKFIDFKTLTLPWKKNNTYSQQIQSKGLSAYCAIKGMADLSQFAKFCGMVDELLDTSLHFILDFSLAVKVPQTGAAILEDMVLNFTDKGRIVCLVQCKTVCPQFTSSPPQNNLYEHFDTLSEAEKWLAESFSTSILLIDNDPDAKNALSNILEFPPMHLRNADFSDSALAAIPKTHPDLVMVDIPLPGRIGMEAIRSIRKRPENDSIPILAMTHDSPLEFDNAIKPFAIQGTLSKPIRPDDLKRKIVSILIQSSPSTRI